MKLNNPIKDQLYPFENTLFMVQLENPIFIRHGKLYAKLDIEIYFRLDNSMRPIRIAIRNQLQHEIKQSD